MFCCLLIYLVFLYSLFINSRIASIFVVLHLFLVRRRGYRLPTFIFVLCFGIPLSPDFHFVSLSLLFRLCHLSSSFRSFFFTGHSLSTWWCSLVFYSFFHLSVRWPMRYYRSLAIPVMNKEQTVNEGKKKMMLFLYRSKVVRIKANRKVLRTTKL